MLLNLLLTNRCSFPGSFYLDQMSDDEDDSIANRPGPSVSIFFQNDIPGTPVSGSFIPQILSSHKLITSDHILFLEYY